MRVCPDQTSPLPGWAGRDSRPPWLCALIRAHIRAHLYECRYPVGPARWRVCVSKTLIFSFHFTWGPAPRP